MKAIMISDKPKWCALMMNGDKTIEVRKNKGLANAIQKLIDEYGYAELYVYCTKGKPNLWLPYERDCFELDEASQPYLSDKPIIDIDTKMNGKVIFKFRCYKVDDYINGRKWSWKVGAPMWGATNDYEYILKDACLTDDELRNYADDLAFIAIHISDLEIFDKPKELSEFKIKDKEGSFKKPFKINAVKYLTKAPRSWCYVEDCYENL